MELNPHYDQIGKTFVQQYYTCFDDPTQRASLAVFYNIPKNKKYVDGTRSPVKLKYGCIMKEEKSLMTFEDQQIFGRAKIMEKIQGLTFQKILHIITSIDTQPMFDGGILICVLGQLKTDDDHPHTFHQIFVLKTLADGFYVEHDIFRLALHHIV